MLVQIGPGVWSDPARCLVSIDLAEALDSAGLDPNEANMDEVRNKIIGMASALFPRAKLEFHEHGFPLRN